MAAKKKTAAKKATNSATATQGSTNKYGTIGAVMVAKAKGVLPRGAKFVINGGRVQLRVETKHTGQTLYDGDAGEVARWGLRKMGFKADHAA
jgi:hypothetical protein